MTTLALSEIPATQRNEALVPLRYEDVAQDGRLMLTPMTTGLGDVIWRGLLAQHAGARTMERSGIVPILSRLAITAGADGPISVHHRIRARGGYTLAHATGPTGEVERLYLLMRLDLEGQVDVTHGPKPKDAGTTLALGEVLAEHVFTRPFAEPAKRKVLSLEGVPDMPPLPPLVWRSPSTADVLALPPGAAWLEDAPKPSAPITFRSAHTDANLHVNSLVYPRLFETAILSRLDELGVAHTDRLLARSLDATWRKPSFAGDTVHFLLRAFATAEGHHGATGVLTSGEEPRPRAVFSMIVAPLRRR